MLDRAGEHIGDGLDAAMRMPGKAGAIVVGPVVAEIVEQQERIEFGRVAEAEGAMQLDAGAFHGRLRLDDPLDGSDGHDALVLCGMLDRLRGDGATHRPEREPARSGLVRHASRRACQRTDAGICLGTSVLGGFAFGAACFGKACFGLACFCACFCGCAFGTGRPWRPGCRRSCCPVPPAQRLDRPDPSRTDRRDPSGSAWSRSRSALRGWLRHRRSDAAPAAARRRRSHARPRPTCRS